VTPVAVELARRSKSWASKKAGGRGRVCHPCHGWCLLMFVFEVRNVSNARIGEDRVDRFAAGVLPVLVCAVWVVQLVCRAVTSEVVAMSCCCVSCSAPVGAAGAGRSGVQARREPCQGVPPRPHARTDRSRKPLFTRFLPVVARKFCVLPEGGPTGFFSSKWASPSPSVSFPPARVVGDLSGWALGLVGACCEETCGEAAVEAEGVAVSCGGVVDVAAVGGRSGDGGQGPVGVDVGGCVGCWCGDGDCCDQQGVACGVAGVGGGAWR